MGSIVLLLARVLNPAIPRDWFGVVLIGGVRRYAAFNLNVSPLGVLTIASILPFGAPPLPWATMVAIGWIEAD